MGKPKLTDTTKGKAYLIDVSFRVHPEYLMMALYDHCARFQPTSLVPTVEALLEREDRAALFRLMGYYYSEGGYKAITTMNEPEDKALLDKVINHVKAQFPELFIEAENPPPINQ